MNEFLTRQLISFGDFTMTLGHLLTVTFIVIAAWFLSRFLKALITGSYKKGQKRDARKLSISQLVTYLIWTLAVVNILKVVGLNLTFLLASSAALMVGVGLGLQNVFKDFVSGLIILIEGTIKIGDVVEIDGLVMKITDISIRVSKATTREEIDVIIPNHRFVEENVTNWSFDNGPARFVISMGVNYKADVKAVEKILLNCALQNKDVLNVDPFTPRIQLRKFGSTTLDFQLAFYSFNLFGVEATKSIIRFHILEEFNKAGIDFPTTQNVMIISEQQDNPAQ